MESVEFLPIKRRTESLVIERLREEPVVLIEGPRAVGKSTLLRAVADETGGDVLDLDNLAIRDAVTVDPALFMSGPAPIVVDEYQKAPFVLDAIKSELNRSTQPGRFLLAGSTRYETLPEVAQSLTGRLNRVSIYPFTQAEIDGVTNTLVPRLFDDDSRGVIVAPASTTNRNEYIQRIVRGGFPLAITRRPVARGRWFDDYVRLTLERDARELGKVRQGAALPRLLARLASQTGQVLNLTAAGHDIGLAAATVESYTKLLEAVFLIQQLPAWGTTLSTRSAARPKVHVIDSGVAARLLRLTPERLASRNPTALTEFGHLLETFVIGEIVRQTSWGDSIAGLGHWRTHDGDEVDLVIEHDNGTIVAFEVKAGSRVPGEQFEPLRKLRDYMGDNFIAGITFYLGERSYTFEDRLHVMPVDRLWT
jgi:predicted AAA+ superfamily ATPase